MAYTDEELSWIYDRTDGYCHLCHRKISFCNYACYGSRGAWEVEHSIPRSRGGTDHLNNLFAACISCNRQKALCASRTVRYGNGHLRAPRSRNRKAEIRRSNTVKGAAIGAFIGSFGGVPGAIICSAIGAELGSSLDPND